MNKHHPLPAKFFGRTLRSAATAVMALAALPLAAHAQSTLSLEQKQGFQKIFGVSTKTMDFLNDAQDKMTKAPLSPLEFGHKTQQFAEKFAATHDAMTPGDRAMLVLTLMHDLSLDLTALDHTVSLSSDPNAVDQYGEEKGPARSSWALCIFHLAIYEAVNTIGGKSASYTKPAGPGEPPAKSLQTQLLEEARLTPADVVAKEGTLEAAIFYAAHDTIIRLYPKKFNFIDAASTVALNQVRGAGVSLGREIGQAAAKVVLRSRGWSEAAGFTDGSEFPEPPASAFATNDVKKWMPDPITKLPAALGGQWPHVQTFVLEKAEQFRPLPPPAFGSPEFIEAFKEVKSKGGDNFHANDAQSSRWHTNTSRTGDMEGTLPYQMNETLQGIYWGYDGTAQLCAPPRLYNLIATKIAMDKFKVADVHDMARILALVNLALGDAGIAAWEGKYHYLYPRPITYIRNADADSTPEGRGDSRWTPLGAPVTNGEAGGRNMTPPFPAYPSGHAVFGGALFQVLRRLAAEKHVTDEKFEFVSDEYNGLNYSPGDSQPRKKTIPPVPFKTFAEAEDGNGQSRIYLGIHWRFDKTAGIAQGNEVGNFIFDHALKLNAAP